MDLEVETEEDSEVETEEALEEAVVVIEEAVVVIEEAVEVIEEAVEVEVVTEVAVVVVVALEAVLKQSLNPTDFKEFISQKELRKLFAQNHLPQVRVFTMKNEFQPKTKLETKLSTESGILIDPKS